MQRTTIYRADRPTQPYLTRTHVFPWWDRKDDSRFPFAVKLHTIWVSDSDPHLHNHPWGFVSMILRGSYDEEKLRRNGTVSVRRRRRFGVAFRGANSFHRITLNGGPVRTLVITGRRTQDWGFMVDGEVIPWRRYCGA